MNRMVRYGLGIAVPPVGVLLTYGVTGTFLLNIGLSLLGWVPGIIHAVWAISKYEEKHQQQLN